MKKHRLVALDQLVSGTHGVVRQLQGGKEFASRLAAMGLSIGRMVRTAYGPILNMDAVTASSGGACAERGGVNPMATIGISWENLMENYRNILLATDFSEHSEWAARRADDVARRLGARLTVFHVIDYCPEDIPPDIVSPEDLNPGEILVHRAGSSLTKLANRCGLSDGVQHQA